MYPEVVDRGRGLQGVVVVDSKSLLASLFKNSMPMALGPWTKKVLPSEFRYSISISLGP